jgi:hypothetical protein
MKDPRNAKLSKEEVFDGDDQMRKGGLRWVELTPFESATLLQIINRAATTQISLGNAAPGFVKFDTMTAHMDILAVHSNGCPLNFYQFLTSSDQDFMHDFIGINKAVDRATGKLMHNFVPHCAVSKPTYH